MQIRWVIVFGFLFAGSMGAVATSVPAAVSSTTLTELRSAQPRTPLPLGRHATYTSLYSFEGGTDGAGPMGALVFVNGKLYGTTQRGGVVGGPSELGYGTVFEVDRSGHERVLHAFQSGRDGAFPWAGLIAVGNKLYGTTAGGGDERSNTNGYGTVFEVSASGTERVLYSFKGGRDGAGPFGGLVALDGKLYGATSYGGENHSGGNGTIFEIDASGAERVLYRFKGVSDGQEPAAALVAMNGALYGTTSDGGTKGSHGTVFEVTTSGVERVLYEFKQRVGSDATAPLLAVDGKLDGTTYGGGAGFGTVFSIDTSGEPRVLHRFTGAPDGAYPVAGLTEVGGGLFGTTNFGGAFGSSRSSGSGTIFGVTTSGDEKIVYSFQGEPDGAHPQSNLIVVGRDLYGTTAGGGTSGYGTVFKLTL